MFFHNYKYRIKCIVRDRDMMFWTLLFPIVLAVLFNLALGDISNADRFQAIELAVVNNSSSSNNQDFVETIDKVSDKKSDDPLFKTQYTSENKAKKLLEDNKIQGYILLDNDIDIVVNQSGINQTIIKSFVDEYKQTSSTIKKIIKENPSAINKETLDNLFERTNYLKEVSVSKESPDSSINYFYTLIAMACLYGSFLGIKEISAIQANQSSQGARINAAPTHKLKLFTVSLLAVTTVQAFNIGILMLFLNFVLKINFSNQLGYVLLTCLIGSITGITFGTFIGIIIKKGEGVKMGILVGFTMTMSFLSGMMYDKMKYIVDTKVPLLGYINPVNLIADSFYSLYFYDTLTKYFINIGILCVLSLIFSGITYLVLRGQKYASL